MAYDRRQVSGNAPATTLSSGINNSTTTIPLTDGTGYPDGSVGNFYIAIDRGLATEEKVLCDTRASNTITAVSRGADGTSAFAHSSGASVEHVFTAVDADEANAHYADATLDHHTNYLTTGRHDLEARHTFGAAYGTPATPTTVEVGTAAAAGSGNNPSKEDHQHAFTGGLLTITHYQAGSGYSMNSSTLADVDATNLAVAFTTPANGKVVVKLHGTVEPQDSAQTMYFGLRESSSTITNSEQIVIRTDEPLGNSFQVRVVYTMYLTGVSAGAHTYKWAWRRASGGSTIALAGGASYPLTMEVWAAP